MVSIPQKAQILRFAAEQGVVTLEDVARHLLKSHQIPAVRTALHESGLTHTKYGPVKQGIWYIKTPSLFSTIQYYFPELPSFKIRRLYLYLVDHSLELNCIRSTLEQTTQITIGQWWSENYIRALPSQLGLKIANNIPDAIFWRRRTDNSLQKFFLEYERSLKNNERYKEIFRCYAKRDDVRNKNVIYLCHNLTIKSRLEAIEAKLVKSGELDGHGYFQFILLDDFYKTYSNNKPKQEERNEEIKESYQNPNVAMLPAYDGSSAS